MIRLTRLAGGLLMVAAASGCRNEPLRREVAGGDPARGRQVLEAYGCGACHVIPGVRLARGTVGPPLTSFGERRFIAGAVANIADNLIRWIQAPQSIEPGTAMPALGLSEQEARDASAYLYTLGSPPDAGAPYMFRPDILEKGSSSRQDSAKHREKPVGGVEHRQAGGLEHVVSRGRESQQ